MVLRLLIGLAAFLLSTPEVDAQFRRGMLADSIEITVYPHEPPALLLPAGPVQIEVRNATGAPARIVTRLRELFERQLVENDPRLQVVPAGGGVVLTATIVEWNEARRNSTKYVSETRQVGSKQVKDKNGNYKTEPVYEYGRNKPSVVIQGAAALRVEVRRQAGGTPLADETARHAIADEYLAEAGPPTREAVEDQLLDEVVSKGAGRVSAGRRPVRIMLARSDDVEPLNRLAQERRWLDWHTALQAVRAHRDPKRDAYRLHNLAVAEEALAYESNTPEDWKARLALADSLIARASAQNPGEKYITEAAGRIAGRRDAYDRLARLFAEAGVVPSSGTAVSPAPSSPGSQAAAPPPPPPAVRALPMSNQDVIDLRAAGLDDANLLAAIADAPAVAFDLSPAGLKALLGARVSNKVIGAMRARGAK